MASQSSYSGQLRGLASKAKADGEKEASAHRPTTDSTRLDHNEAAIESEGTRWLSGEQRIFEAVIADAARVAADLKQQVLALRDRIAHLLMSDSLHSTVDADMAEHKQGLIAATERRLRAEVDWNYFRTQNAITEQAEYPKSKIWHLAIIAILALVETVINAFFYENDQGLLGGFFVALSVAAVNMTGAFFLGLFFRYTNLATTSRKLLGWTTLLAFVVLSIYCNALFSAFRSEYQVVTDPTNTLLVRHAFREAANQAWAVFSLNMHFADLMSFILFALGLILSCFAFYKGYSSDDRYPGYGKKDRALEEAREAELNKQDQLRLKIRDLLSRSRMELVSTIKEPADLSSRAGARIAEIQHAIATLAAHTKAVQRDFEFVLGEYRSANTAIRATETPEYFRHIPDLSTTVNYHAADVVVSDLAMVQEQARDLREQHHQALGARLNGVQNEAASILNTSCDKFFRNVAEEAEANINRRTPTIHRGSAGVTNAQ